ncbi:MAG: BREX system P-loop protein BrxC, partial [Deinococcota bacterium]|nr:BREX system P-loop protein BrxC [Deinococcota bacterium]
MKDIFKKDIDRSINGVIKVGQLREEDITQELDEYVITRELSGYFEGFYRHYINALSQPTDRIGVWISGFFGSGKSHFLKILSYLLENKASGGKTALDYFQPKVNDSFLYASMQRAGEVSKDVILFNIDSKADSSSKADKEAIVTVFLKVFNEHLGYFGVTPGIAELERRLEAEGKYEAFQAAYEEEVGRSWTQTREKWDFYEDEVISSLQKALEISESAARTTFERADENYPRSPEAFARTIKTYLQNKPRGHQVLFLVDEVGQYIGDNSNLMLNLQT